MAAFIFIKIRAYERNLETTTKGNLIPNLCNMISSPQRNWWEIQLGESFKNHVFSLFSSFSLLIWFFNSPPSFDSDNDIIWVCSLVQIRCEGIQKDRILSPRNVECSDRFCYTTKFQTFVESFPVKGGNFTIWLSLFIISIIYLNIWQQQVQRNEVFFHNHGGWYRPNSSVTWTLYFYCIFMGLLCKARDTQLKENVFNHFYLILKIEIIYTFHCLPEHPILCRKFTFW